MSPKIIFKKTGTCRSAKIAANLDYLGDETDHSVMIPVWLAPDSIQDFVGKPVTLFSKSAGLLRKLEPESRLTIDPDGRTRRVKTGILSQEKASLLMKKCESGEELFVLRYRPRATTATTIEYITRREKGEVFPLTHIARLDCLKLGSKEGDSVAVKARICRQVMRSALHPLQPSQVRRQHVRGSKGDCLPVYAHNLVVAPSPSVLKSIRDKRLPVDDILEIAARRAIEWLERKTKAKIWAFAGLHMEDSTSVRPHLHVRLGAYDSNGKYVALFDRKRGSAGGNRVIFQDELERQVIRLIERTELRERQR